MTKIGVFDSGVGGLSVANALHESLPEVDIILREDKENLPYGTKSPDQLLLLVAPILEEMVVQGCEAIVIACNTVTTNIIEELRQVIKVPLVGMEPMIKPAAEITKTSTIAVFATPATLGSKRYAWLKQEYANGVKVIEPDCSTWAMMIEENRFNKDSIKQDVNQALSENADVLVLGCTHYHWIEEEIRELVNDEVTILQPEQPVLEQLKKVLAL